MVGGTGLGGARVAVAIGSINVLKAPAQPAERRSVEQLVAEALAHHEAGRIDQAERGYLAAQAADPDHADPPHFLGVIAHQRGDHARAVQLMRLAIERNPAVASYHNNIGEALRALGRMTEAGIAYSEALRLAPDYPLAHLNLGILLHDIGLHTLAIEHLQKSLKVQPDARVHTRMALCLRSVGRLEDALAACSQALALLPNDAEAHNNRGVILRELDRMDEARAALERALEIDPTYVIAYNNLGLVLQDTGQLDAAIERYDQAIRLKPDYVDAHWNQSLGLLLSGNLKRGWDKYEWRWHRPEVKPPDINVPEWEGDDPKGKTILVYPEQGFGDTIQFVRYVPLLRDRGARVLVGCQVPLVPLIESLDGYAEIVPEGAALPPTHKYISMLSLPRRFQTRLDSVPADVPYLAAPPDRVAQWAERLAAVPRPRVAIAWSGNPSHPNDRTRSISAVQFARLLTVRGIGWVSVQKTRDPREIELLAPLGTVYDAAPGLGDFADTAAVVANCDLVLTVDTSVAHVAGAMALPVWSLLAFANDWRWMRDRPDTPWYPTMRLIRQPKTGDWDSVFDRVIGGLKRLAKTKTVPEKL